MSDEKKDDKTTDSGAEKVIDVEPAKQERPAGGAEEFDPAIRKLGDAIAALTLKKAVALAAYLKAQHGIEPAAGAAVVAAPAAEVEEEVMEKTIFDVILKEVGDQRVKVIKAVKAMTELRLTEAAALVDGAPNPVKEGIPKEEAEEALKKLTDAGGVAEIV